MLVIKLPAPDPAVPRRYGAAHRDTPLIAPTTALLQALLRSRVVLRHVGFSIEAHNHPLGDRLLALEGDNGLSLLEQVLLSPAPTIITAQMS